MTERPIKFWKFTLIFIMIMIGLSLSKLSFGAETICFVNNLKHWEVTAVVKTVRSDVVKNVIIAPDGGACYTVDSGETGYIIELKVEASHLGSYSWWSSMAFYGVGVYNISIENNFLRAMARP